MCEQSAGDIFSGIAVNNLFQICIKKRLIILVERALGGDYDAWQQLHMAINEAKQTILSNTKAMNRETYCYVLVFHFNT